MTFPRLLLVVCALAGASAFAQSLTVGSVHGVATAMNGGSARPLSAGAAVGAGTMITSTSKGSVTLQGSDGCSVKVPPGHGVSVKPNMDCKQLQAGVAPTGQGAGARSAGAQQQHQQLDFTSTLSSLRSQGNGHAYGPGGEPNNTHCNGVGNRNSPCQGHLSGR